MIERDLKGLHFSHGKPRHRAMITVGRVPECRVDEGDQDLYHIVFKGADMSCLDFIISGDPKAFPVKSGARLAVCWA